MMISLSAARMRACSCSASYIGRRHSPSRGRTPCCSCLAGTRALHAVGGARRRRRRGRARAQVAGRVVRETAARSAAVHGVRGGGARVLLQAGAARLAAVAVLVHALCTQLAGPSAGTGVSRSRRRRSAPPTTRSRRAAHRVWWSPPPSPQLDRAARSRALGARAPRRRRRTGARRSRPRRRCHRRRTRRPLPSSSGSSAAACPT